MPIKYAVRLNKLTTPNSYAPKVMLDREVSFNELLERAARESGMPRAQIDNALAAVARARDAELLEGNLVRVRGFGRYAPSLRARLASENAPLPPTAEWDITVVPGKAMLEEFRQNAQGQRVASANLLPDLRKVILRSGNPQSLNDGDVIEITGERLGFNADHVDEGVFLTFDAFQNQPAATVRMTNYLRKGEKMIQGIVPMGWEAPQLGVRVEVRARAKNAAPTAQLRVGVFQTDWHTSAP